MGVDPKHGSPPPWAQNCAYLCTYSVMVQCILVLVMPYVTQCECKCGIPEGDVVVVGLSPALFVAMTVKQLKQELRELHEPSTGLKNDLQARLAARRA